VEDREGSYYCDCGTSNGDFAGLFCEYEAEQYCRFSQEVTSSWFCANRGTCVVAVNAAESDWKCDCPPDYEGPVGGFVVFGVKNGSFTLNGSLFLAL